MTWHYCSPPDRAHGGHPAYHNPVAGPAPGQNCSGAPPRPEPAYLPPRARHSPSRNPGSYTAGAGYGHLSGVLARPRHIAARARRGSAQCGGGAPRPVPSPEPTWYHPAAPHPALPAPGHSPPQRNRAPAPSGYRTNRHPGVPSAGQPWAIPGHQSSETPDTGRSPSAVFYHPRLLTPPVPPPSAAYGRTIPAGLLPS